MKRVRLFETILSLVVLLSLALSACTPGLLNPGSNNNANPETTGDPTQASKAGSVPETGKGEEPTVVSATGDILPQADEFRARLGDDNGGEPVGKPSGRREVNWDGIPDELAAPADYLGDFFNVSVAPRARGIFMVTPGRNFMVSADSENSTGAAVRFGNLNPQYPQVFKAFSEERIFAPVGSNVFDVGFFVPGTTRPALVNAFGAVFADVDGPGTFIEFYDQKSTSLGRFEVPVADNDLSFLGVIFDAPLVYRVRVKLGNSPLGSNDGEGIDVVVMDDFIYGEPQPLTGAVIGKVEPPKSGSAIRETQSVSNTVTTTETVGLAPTATAAPGTPVEEFLLDFVDVENKRLASVSVDLTGLAPAPEGKTYALWLTDYSRNPFFIGEAIPGQTFTYADPAGKNLISRFMGAVLSLEDSTAVQAKAVQAPTAVIYSGEIPVNMLPLLQRLVVAATDTAGETPYVYGLQEQAAIADHHGNLLIDALRGGDLGGAKTHMEHIWNTLVGLHSTDFGDKNGDGRSENPGDGFGFLLYAGRVVGLLDQIAEMEGVNEHYQEGAATASLCTRSIANRLGPEVKSKALVIFSAEDPDQILQEAEILVSTIATMAKGFDTDGNGTIDAAEGECGATQVNELVRRLYHVHLAKNAEANHSH
jgi:hypothetical protein